MNFSKDTITILKNFALINPGVVLNPGQHIMTRSANGATHSEAFISETIESQLAILDLNGFLNILSMSSEDAEIEASGGDIVIKSEKSEIHWPAADASMVVVPKKAINFPPAKVEFDLVAEDFNQLMRVARGLNCDTLAIKNENGKIVIATFNKLADTELKKELFKLEVSDNYVGEDFKFVINIANLKMLPDSYRVLLWAKQKMFAAKFQGAMSSYVLAVEITSEHKFED